MVLPEVKPEPETEKRAKPTPQQVKRLQEEFPRLDYLMAETLLSFSDDELIGFASEAKE